MSHIEATGPQLQALSALEHDGPIHMLNLLRYVPDTGRARYGEYKRAVMPLLAAAGARLVTTATPRVTVIGPADETWDEMIVVEYPSTAAFFQMVTSPEYQAIQHLRSEGLADSRLVCMAPGAPAAD